MTPSQLLRSATPPEDSPCPPVVEAPKYTSDVADEDLDTSVNLLLGSIRFLLFLQDANTHYDLLGDKAAADLDKHIELLEDFTGQWNEEQVY